MALTITSRTVCRMIVPALLIIISAITTAAQTAQPAASPSSPATEAKAVLPAATPREDVNKEDLTKLPLDKGLPLIVRTGLNFIEVLSIDENEATFKATIDLRLTWVDLRLRYDASETPAGFKEFRGSAADSRMAEIWMPGVELANMLEQPSAQMRGLRIFPSGQVEYIQRLTAQFSTPFNVEQFPFDRQILEVKLLVNKDNITRVKLDFLQQDLDFSTVSKELEIDGWAPRLVNITRDPQLGWYGETHSRLLAALEISRRPGHSVATIFIPLFASLLIPLLAIWLNKVEDGEFQIDAFELANIMIGGLFAVIALNFTVNSEYHMLASGDNTVTRLFALNYLTLAISLGTSIILFRFNLLKKLVGIYVQEQIYLFIAWAVPVMALVSAVAIFLVAMV
jgi:hypothetical protein